MDVRSFIARLMHNPGQTRTSLKLIASQGIFSRELRRGEIYVQTSGYLFIYFVGQSLCLQTVSEYCDIELICC